MNDEVEANVLSIIAHVIGYDQPDVAQPPVPAANARDAQFLMMNWIVSNTTDEDITWHFPTNRLFLLELVRICESGYDVLWTFETDQDADPGAVEITIAKGDTFAIPDTQDADDPDIDDGIGAVSDDDDGGDEDDELVEGDIEELPPIVPLAEIISAQAIPDADELAVRFSLQANEFRQVSIIPLWR